MGEKLSFKEYDRYTLLAWRLGRLGRSMVYLVNLVQSLFERQIGFKSLCDGAIDTTTASGELIFNIFSAMAQFERRLIQERTRAGLASARARGRVGGRPLLKSDDPKVITARKMYENKSLSIDDICKTLCVSRATFFRYIKMK